jgi:hypothetical protein
MKQKIGVPREYLASERTAESEPPALRHDETRPLFDDITLLPALVLSTGVTDLDHLIDH